MGSIAPRLFSDFVDECAEASGPCDPCAPVHGDSDESERHNDLAETVQGELPQWDRRADRTVIVGLGNEIAGDDAVGILAARRLSQQLRRLNHIDVVELPWGGLSLLHALRGYRRAILIDSLRSGDHAPGRVIRLSEADFAGSVRLTSFHDVNYPTAMALGRTLGWSVPTDVEIFAVEGAVFDQFRRGLTPPVSRGLDEVVQVVASRVDSESFLKRHEELEVTHAGGR